MRLTRPGPPSMRSMMAEAMSRLISKMQLPTIGAIEKMLMMVGEGTERMNSS